MRWLRLSTLKSNSSEQTSEGLQTRSFSYSVSQTYMSIPTNNLLSRFLPIPGKAAKDNTQSKE